MKKYTDKELADFVLEMRQHNGRAPSWGYFKRNVWRMVLFFGFAVILFGLGMFAQSWWFCGFVLGWVVGIFSRDRALLQRQQAVWSFYARVIDWLKVEKISSGETSA